MNRPLPFSPRYTHVAGDVRCANGRAVTLADAIDLAAIWGREAIRADQFGHRSLARVYARDALAIHMAAEAAIRWRQASGRLYPIAMEGARA
jgi:hypothetical protein